MLPIKTTLYIVTFIYGNRKHFMHLFDYTKQIMWAKYAIYSDGSETNKAQEETITIRTKKK